MRPALILSVAILLVTAPRPVDQAPVTTVAPAYVTEGAVSFDPPLPLPWDSLLLPGLQPAALAADEQRRQEYYALRSESGQTTVPFSLVIPAVLRQRAYHLLDAAGARRIVPAGLIGKALLRWADSSAVVLSLSTSGQLYARIDRPSDGGFVLSSDGPVRLTTTPSQLTADQLLAPHGAAYPYRGTSFWTIVRQYEVHQTSPAEERWVWVQWRPDSAMVEAGCSLRFALFRLTPAPVQVGSQESGCDV
jgi:hypothetical protein